MKRKVWRRVRSEGTLNTGTYEWKECTDYFRPIVIPPKKVHRGPVGEFEEASNLFSEWAAQSNAVRVHKLAAMEKHHLQVLLEPSGSEPNRDGQQPISSFKPFGCLASDCDAWFERPGEYTSHAIESDHDKYHDIPEPFKNIFSVNEERLNRMRDFQIKRCRAVCDWWGEHGSEQREMAKREYIHQLRNDPLWAGREPDNEQRLWDSIEVCLNGY